MGMSPSAYIPDRVMLRAIPDLQVNAVCDYRLKYYNISGNDFWG